MLNPKSDTGRLEPLTYLLGAAGEVFACQVIEAVLKPGWPSKVNPSSWAAAVLSRAGGMS